MSNKLINSLFVVLIIGSATSLMTYADNQNAHHNSVSQSSRHNDESDDYRHGKNRHEYMKEMMAQEFSADEVKTLVGARLLMRGERNLKVGEINPTDTGYKVTIITKKNGDIVRTLNLAKNGFPIDRVTKWKGKYGLQ